MTYKFDLLDRTVYIMIGVFLVFWFCWKVFCLLLLSLLHTWVSCIWFCFSDSCFSLSAAATPTHTWSSSSAHVCYSGLLVLSLGTSWFYFGFALSTYCVSVTSLLFYPHKFSLRLSLSCVTFLLDFSSELFVHNLGFLGKFCPTCLSVYWAVLPPHEPDLLSST